jgi:hypothetical protein
MSDAKSFLSLVGVGPSKATVENSTLVIIDAQNEYNFLTSSPQGLPIDQTTRYADGALKTVNVDSTRKSIASVSSYLRSTRDDSFSSRWDLYS